MAKWKTQPTGIYCICSSWIYPAAWLDGIVNGPEVSWVIHGLPMRYVYGNMGLSSYWRRYVCI